MECSLSISLHAENQRNVVAPSVQLRRRKAEAATALWWTATKAMPNVTAEGAILGDKAAVSATAWLVAPFRMTTERLFGLWLCSKDEIFLTSL